MYNFIISSYTIHKSLYFYFLIEVINLTNINCSSNCIYQKDGKCYFENISTTRVTPSNDCAYFISKNQKLKN
jgi:hypothetical protein